MTLDRLKSWESRRENHRRRDLFREADGNEPGRAEDTDGNETWDLVQSRTDNKVNEISGISNSVGSAWVTPVYNRAGNMTTIPQPADPTKGYTGTYDAWNRLVKIVDVPTGQAVQENAFDGRTFRVVKKSYTAGVLSETRQLFFSTGWQVVEERIGAATAAERQFVWGLRYIDDLVVRDRDTTGGGTLNERLYALQDGNWNVVALASSSGTVQERYAYSAYGVPAVLTGAFGARGSSSYVWEVLSTSYRLDSSVQFYHVRERELHSRVGVWLTRDRLRVNASYRSVYEYVGSSPLLLTDPFGQAAGKGVTVSVGGGDGIYVEIGGSYTWKDDTTGCPVGQQKTKYQFKVWASAGIGIGAKLKLWRRAIEFVYKSTTEVAEGGFVCETACFPCSAKTPSGLSKCCGGCVVLGMRVPLIPILGLPTEIGLGFLGFGISAHGYWQIDARVCCFAGTGCVQSGCYASLCLTLHLGYDVRASAHFG